MKTIKYLLIAIFIISLVSTGLIYKPTPAHTILLRATESSISPVFLSRSAEILARRLKSFSNEKSEVYAVSESNQIKVSLYGDWDLETAEKLLTQTGTLEFYETYNFRKLTELLDDHGNKLVSLLHRKDPRDSSAEIGCVSPSEVHIANEYLGTLSLDKTCKFFWSNLFEKPEACLYALRLVDGDGALLKGKYLEDFKFNADDALKKYQIEFKVSKPLIPVWAEITRRNINNSIAIVLDNKVIYAPVVRDEITGGSCVISGNFTKSEMQYLASVVESGELPVNFKVMK